MKKIYIKYNVGTECIELDEESKFSLIGYYIKFPFLLFKHNNINTSLKQNNFFCFSFVLGCSLFCCCFYFELLPLFANGIATVIHLCIQQENREKEKKSLYLLSLYIEDGQLGIFVQKYNLQENHFHHQFTFRKVKTKIKTNKMIDGKWMVYIHNKEMFLVARVIQVMFLNFLHLKRYFIKCNSFNNTKFSWKHNCKSVFHRQ